MKISYLLLLISVLSLFNKIQTSKTDFYGNACQDCCPSNTNYRNNDNCCRPNTGCNCCNSNSQSDSQSKNLKIINFKVQFQYNLLMTIQILDSIIKPLKILKIITIFLIIIQMLFLINPFLKVCKNYQTIKFHLTHNKTSLMEMETEMEDGGEDEEGDEEEEYEGEEDKGEEDKEEEIKELRI